MNNKKVNDLIDELILEHANKNKIWKEGIDWVQYSGPYFDGSETKSAIVSLLNGWLGLGESGIKFENKFCKELGKNYGIFVNSGSSANLLMISSLKSKNLYNLPPGTKIATACAGFPTTINPIIQNGFTPVFVDIELNTLNIDLNKLEEVLEKEKDIKVLIFAHVLGNCPDMDKVMELVKKYNLILLEDCCDALGSTYKGKLLGSFGDMASCSFYPAHHITTGEGGFVAVNTKEQEKVIRSLRDWGRGCYCSGQASVCLKNGFCKKRFFPWLKKLPNTVVDHKYVYDEIGYNLKPLELQACIGLEQIKKLPIIHQKRKENHNKISNIFKKYSEYFLVHSATPNSDPSWFACPITVKENKKFTRTDISKYFEDNKIQTRNYFAGNILLQPGYENIASNSENYPVSTYVTINTFFLGTSPVITNEQVLYIEKVLNKFMESII